MKKITKNVDIKIMSEQTFIGEEKPKTMDLQTDGKIIINGNTIQITYDEILIDETSGTFSNTQIYFQTDQPNIVHLDRSGDITTTGVFETNERYMLAYVMPFGTLELAIYTKVLENNITEDGGTLKIVYDVEHLGSVMFSNVFYLECTLT